MKIISHNPNKTFVMVKKSYAVVFCDVGNHDGMFLALWVALPGIQVAKKSSMMSI